MFPWFTFVNCARFVLYSTYVRFDVVKTPEVTLCGRRGYTPSLYDTNTNTNTTYTTTTSNDNKNNNNNNNQSKYFAIYASNQCRWVLSFKQNGRKKKRKQAVLVAITTI